MAMPDHTALAHFRAENVPIFTYFTAAQHALRWANQGDCRNGIS